MHLLHSLMHHETEKKKVFPRKGFAQELLHVKE